MEGMAFLEKALFTAYHYNAPPPSSPRSDASTAETNNPVFAVSLPSLLETLQIFGLTAESKPNPFSSGGAGRDTFANNAFSNSVLGINGICRLNYDAPGAPLTIVIEEQGIRTTCKLNTYEPSFVSDIPFSRENIAMKVIMRAGYLFDAIAELSNNNPQVITLSARKRTFTVAASSPLGSATVDFHRDAQGTTHRAPAANEHGDEEADGENGQKQSSSGLLETYLLATDNGSFSQSYKFAHVASTKKALQAATKVSIRADEQGVLSLQFMIENLEGGGVSFVDFRFVPLVGDDDEREGMSEGGEGDQEEYVNGIGVEHEDEDE
jgi:cell cycle checkpoint protein